MDDAIQDESPMAVESTVTTEPTTAAEAAAESLSSSSPDESAVQPDALQSLLDGLAEETDSSDAQASEASLPSGQERGPDGRFAARNAATETQQTDQDAPEQPEIPPLSASLSPEAAEEAELLKGVHERHHARIKDVLAQRREAEGNLSEFRQMVDATGLSPQDFAQLLEFGRMIHTNDAANLRGALAMVDDMRTHLCRHLGVDAPGVELLADFPDLAQAVQNMHISREHAVEMAKLRRETHTAQQTQQFEQTQRQQQQQFDQSLAFGQQAIAEYLNRRAQEADHPARLQAIHAYFQQPANREQFAANYQPHQWASVIQLMYDAVRVAPQAPVTAAAQPLRTKPAPMGAPTFDPRLSSYEQLDQQFRAVGI